MIIPFFFSLFFGCTRSRNGANLKGFLQAYAIPVYQDEQFPAGLKKINWDGTNNNREDVAAGVYFYQLIVNETLLSNKMVYLK